MNTQYALHAVFGSPVVKLSEISEQFFGMKYATAKAKVSAHEFPIPAFRLHEETETNKGTKVPLFVSIDDLASYIDKKQAQAKREWEQVYGPSH
ncbi:pyocin activator PrtN family protein [Vibrio ostreicida]|uniref:pyocin activator PrtN family protein n=1 Tax=Vibrio ostreicida TaxID=526588 RepID=UPI000970875C|nr:pyocin activator PrtN family protein [Vibrio ostreicida]